MARGIVCIGEYGTTSEAALAQNLLQENDIESFLAGENTQGWAFGLGPWTQGVRLEVRIEDEERARALVSLIEGRIRERVEREYGTAPLPTPPTGPHTNSAAPRDDLTIPSPDLPDAGEEVPPESEGDAAARRARTAAVFGIALPPVLLFAVVHLVLSATGARAGSLTAWGRRWRRQALALTLLLAGAYVALLAFAL